ncbi:MAG: exopolyphosphatase [Gammaproteobacteria bacterium]|nr:exopolyphosphatase [Gammaproteobacteria bacterium]
MPTPPKSSEVLAAVDLGSNSFHMKIARAYEGELQVLDRMREMIHLGAGLDTSGNITPEAQQRALDCLLKFGERLRAMPRRVVRAVGTNTLRNARNAKEFLVAAERALGHPIKIISGQEEARLIYLGVAHTLADNGQRRLVADIGGGSTELIIGERGAPQNLLSLEMGCVSFSRKYFEAGEITSKRWQRAHTAAVETLQHTASEFGKARWEHAVGASGTIRAVDSVVRLAGWCNDGITHSALERLVEVIVKSGHVERLKIPGLNPERASVFPGGVAILVALFEVLGLNEMRVSDGALREGLLFDMLGWPAEEDTCASSVAALAARFHVDAAQARRVENTARQLLSSVALEWELRDAQITKHLTWAAQLHEIGLDIASNQHHKHGAYIVENADLDGFSGFEHKLLGLLIRAQRGKLPLTALKELPAAYSGPWLRMAVLLRLAVILQRGRSTEALPRFSLAANKRVLKLQFANGWLQTRPLLHADLAQETAYLREMEISLEVG